VRRAIPLAVVAVVAVGLPFVLPPFRNAQLTAVLVDAVAIVGLDLLVGYAGQISLGHGALFALGAYTTAILSVHAGVPVLATIPVAGAVSFLAGLVLGLPALRLRGHYLALVTLAATIAAPQLLKRFAGTTGGSSGLTVPQPSPPAWLGLASDQYLYFVALVVAAIVFALGAGMVRGRVGRALVAIRTNEIAARANGVDLASFKVRAFGASALFAGLGGSLYALTVGFVSPESFTFALSFSFLAGAVVGGLGTIVGALFGALFLEYVPVYASDVNQALAGVVYGAVLMACMYALPGGVVGTARTVARRVAARRAGAGARPVEAPARIEEGVTGAVTVKSR
jgi:branched-chain amino acid transport system permease protein